MSNSMEKIRRCDFKSLQNQPSVLPSLRYIATCILLFSYLVASENYPDWIDDYLIDWRSSVLWILIVGFILAFSLSFAVGANDSANSWGTAVGSNTMTLRMACILGSICETLGAVFLSGNVIAKLTTGIIDINLYKTNITYDNATEEWIVDPAPNNTFSPEKQLMLGEIGVITGSAIWQIVASFFAWPVSGTHSVVGGILGFSLVANGDKGIDWIELAKIAASWVLSPLLAAIFSMTLYYPIRRWIVMADDPLKYGVYAFPVLWGFAGFLNAGVILTTGNIFYDLTGLGKAELWGISVGFGVFIFLLIAITVYCDYWKFEDYRTRGKGVDNAAFNENGNKALPETHGKVDEEAKEVPDIDEDSPETRRLFEALQYVSACSGSLAHGGNDVGNAIGPVVLLWLIYNNPMTFETESSPYWVLLYGGLGITAGLWILGYKTIQTVGKDLAKMTPSRGFSVEIMSAITVQLASQFGIPVSTTHCKVGSVVGIGYIRGRNEVNLKLFTNIAAAWIITIPASGLISAAVYYILYVIVF